MTHDCFLMVQWVICIKKRLLAIDRSKQTAESDCAFSLSRRHWQADRANTRLPITPLLFHPAPLGQYSIAMPFIGSKCLHLWHWGNIWILLNIQAASKQVPLTCRILDLFQHYSELQLQYILQIFKIIKINMKNF